MKQFFKFVFASVVGIFVSMIILGLMLFFAILAIGSAGGKEETAGDNMVLELNLQNEIPERTVMNPFEEIFESDREFESVGLDQILKSIYRAKGDKKVKGIFLKTMPGIGGFASLEEIRNALDSFRKSGKFVYAYAPYYDERNYFLSTVADSLFIEPSGNVLLNGLSANMIFFKGSLDKLGVDMQLIRVGKFKGAAETIVRTDLSEENREQIKSYLFDLNNRLITYMAAGRGRDTGWMRKTINGFEVQNVQQAVRAGLIDQPAYLDQITQMMKAKTKVKEVKDIQFIKINAYLRATKKEESEEKNKIALIYAEGEIVDGNGSNQMIGSYSLSKAISKARENKNVKAIVLRVNSPGGSSLASDMIMREMALCKGVKPVIVSMGDVAASGGYYISCLADSIFAMPTTITGSIGVFGLVPNMKTLLNDKLGITFESVKTGPYSDFGRYDRPLSEVEMQYLQSLVNQVYDDFTGIVEKGRSLDSSFVENIAQGRVWAAPQALQHGLIDGFAGINECIKIAAYKAKLKAYEIEVYPKEEKFLARFFNGYESKTKQNILMKEFGLSYTYVKQIQKALSVAGIQMRTPYTYTID